MFGPDLQVGATSAIPKIITTGFRAVHLIYFFTAGEDEVKCWQIRKQTKAPQVCAPCNLRCAKTVRGARLAKTSFMDLGQSNQGTLKTRKGLMAPEVAGTCVLQCFQAGQYTYWGRSAKVPQQQILICS